MSSMMMRSGTFSLAKGRSLHRGVLHVLLVPLRLDVIPPDSRLVHAVFILIHYLTVRSLYKRGQKLLS